MMMTKKDLNYYMRLPYKVEVLPDEDLTSFTVTIPDLEGCIAFGETLEEAHKMLTEAKQLWIETYLDEGWNIPEPTEEEIKTYSGKFTVRLPRFLHRRLAELAEYEGTSLNQLVVTLLAEGAERLESRIAPEEEMSATKQAPFPGNTEIDIGALGDINSSWRQFSPPHSDTPTLDILQ